VIFYFFSVALSKGSAAGYVVSYVVESFPIGVNEQAVRTWLMNELTKLGHGGAVAGIIGGVTLFWLASILFSTLRTSVNIVFNMSTKKNVIFQKLLDFLLMIIVLALLLTSTFLSPIVNLLQRLGTEVLPHWLSPIITTTAARFLSLAISIVLYGVLFWMLPHDRLPRKIIFVSAATSVILTEAMRFLFVIYMAHISSLRSLYGTYAFLAGISLWLYYASLAFLIGAEIGWLYQDRHKTETVEMKDKSKINPTKPTLKLRVKN
jgi:membrane protein